MVNKAALHVSVKDKSAKLFVDGKELPNVIGYSLSQELDGCAELVVTSRYVVSETVIEGACYCRQVANNRAGEPGNIAE